MPDTLWRFRGVPAINARLSTTLGVVLYSALAGSYVIEGQQLSNDALRWVFFGALIAIAALTLKLNLDRRDDREIALAENTLILPLRYYFGRSMARIPFSEIRSIEFSDMAAAQVLRLNIAGRFPVAIRSGDLESGDLRELHDRIWSEALPRNRNLLTAQGIFERQRLFPLSTILIVALMALVFANSLTGAGDRSTQLIAQGALNQWLVEHGEAFRLGAAALLHSGWPNLIVNCTVLAVVGVRLEHVTGAWMFAGAFAAGLLLGNLSACAWATTPFVVGSSGGVFGLFALYLVTVVEQRKHLPTRTLFAPPIVMLGALLLAFVPLPGYAQSAHVGGFLGGLLWSAGAGRIAQKTRTLAALCAVAWFAVLASTAYATAGKDSWLMNARPLIAELTNDEDPGAAGLYLLAWYSIKSNDLPLQSQARTELERYEPLNASNARLLAELLLLDRRAMDAAFAAYRSYRLRADGLARELLTRAEVRSYRTNCKPVRFAKTSASPPQVSLDKGTLVFASKHTLQVHALVGARHLIMRTGLVAQVPADTRSSDVLILAYSDDISWRRSPSWQRVPPSELPLRACSQSGDSLSLVR